MKGLLKHKQKKSSLLIDPKIHELLFSEDNSNKIRGLDELLSIIRQDVI